jgi:hypothetical protein
MKISIVFLMTLLLSGCAIDIDFKIPSHRFMDPETRGQNIFNGEIGGFAQASLQTEHKVTMTEVFDYGVLGATVSSEQVLSRSSGIGLQGALGIFPRLDVHMRMDADSPSMIIAKVQLLGEHGNDRKDGFKLGVWAGYGTMKESEGQLTVTSGNSTRSYSGEIEIHPWELGLTLGQRFAPAAMVYTSATHAKYPSKSTLTSNVHPTVVVQGTAELQALALGIKLGQTNISCHVEIGASRVRWREQIQYEQEIGTGAVALAIEF